MSEHKQSIDVQWWCHGPVTMTLFSTREEHDAVHTDGSCDLRRQTRYLVTVEERAEEVAAPHPTDRRTG